MSPCADMQEWISAALDGELDPRAKRELDLHLRGCRECAAVRERLERLDVLLARGAGQPSGDLETAIRLRVEGRRAPARRRRRLWWAAAAALLLVAAGVALALRLGRGEGRSLEPRLLSSAAVVSAIHLERALDQETMLDALRCELQALRVEVERLLSAEPDEKEDSRVLLSRIDEALSRVRASRLAGR